MRKSILVFLAATLVTGLCLGQVPANHAPAAQSPASSAASTGTLPAGTVIPAELVRSLDAKKVKAGDEVVAKISQDMLSHGEVVFTQGTKIVGHITSPKPRDKDQVQSEVGIVFDKISLKDGRDIPLNATIQALGRPVSYLGLGDSSTQTRAEGPISGSGGYSASAEGGMSQTEPAPGSAQNTGRPGDYATADASGTVVPMVRGQLPSNAQGVQGLPDFSLNAGAQGSVVSSQKKNVKLDSGTQVLLRVNGA